MPLDGVIRAEDTVLRPVTSFLFKGHNGTGKTIAATGEEFRPVIIANCEGRFESVPTYWRARGNYKDIDHANFPLGTSYYKLDKFMDSLVASCPYRTFLMSSLTSFINLILNHLIQDAFGKKSSKGFDMQKKIGGIPVNQLQDFNAEDSGIINDLIAAMQQLKAQGVNTILEAHITPYEITSLEEGQRVTVTENKILTKGKKAPAQIPVFFNEVYLFSKNFPGFGKPTEYLFNTQGTATDDCKSSWDIKGGEWTGKDLSKIIFGQLNKEILDTPRIDPNAPKTITF